MTLPSSAAEHGRLQQILIDSWYARRRRPQISMHISCAQGAQQQTSRTSLLLSIDGTDRRTDGHPTVTQTPQSGQCQQ